MVAVFCFCWGPYASFAMINISGHGKVDNDVVADIEQNDKNTSTKSRICSVIMPMSRVWHLPFAKFRIGKIANLQCRAYKSAKARTIVQCLAGYYHDISSHIV